MTWAVYNYLFCALIYVFTTNQYVNSEYLFIHGIPEAILEMLATENDAVDCWMRLSLCILSYWLFGNNQYWNQYDKSTSFASNIYFHTEIMILTPTTIHKWSPRDHFEMLYLKNG